ncbi:putative Nsp1-like C-terminal region-domain-containing protein [Seiridium cardinale]|uniref:Nsp1-like C-terminal region-domain-containing protein n=1 Tax=Seiridium cardinale TaxID=138064 RepID=A0ABR2XPW0_9PEZI
MSFTFGTPASSAGQANNNATTSTAPASGSLFGSSSTPAAPTTSLFGQATGTPTFSFGNTSGSTTPAPGGGLFGNPASKPAEQKPLFGAASTTPAPASSTPTTSAGGTELFGGGSGSQPASSGGLFGGGSTQPAAAGLFGNSKPASSGVLVGNTESTPASSATNNTATTTSAFPSAGLFGNKAPEAGTPTSQPSSLFGAAPKSGTASSLFGAANNASAPAGAAGSNSSGSLFGTPNTATTSSGPAPATTTTSASSAPLFGSANTAGSAPTATPAKPLFGMNSTTPAGLPPMGAQKKDEPKVAGGGLFGNMNSTAPKTGSSLFNNAGSSSTSNTATPTTAAPNLLSEATKSATTESATPSAPAANSLFGKAAEPATAQPAATTAGGTPSLFAKTSDGGSSTPASTGASTGGLFSNKPATTTTAEAPKPASSLFGAQPPSSASTPTTTSAPEKPSLFSSAKPAANTTTDAAAPTTGSLLGGAKPTSTLGASSAATNLAASTTGPTSQLARLKNKTMDEIITRWATDLSKYQKEFKEQAAQVAAWDRLLVENGAKIQELYLNTFEAEKASRDVERVLSNLEGSQGELEGWLDKYEAEVDQMFSRDIGRTDTLTGPDQEREKTYKLAEKLTDRLDEMGRDLSKMIKEINDISGTLSKGNKPDDPLSQIVRVLNNHLTQLQWIDTNAAALQAKVNAAQKAGATVGNHYGGVEQDAAESFYRSYLGGRR